MRAVFLGNDVHALEALTSCCDVVGVYVPAPNSAMRSLQQWLLDRPAVHAYVSARVAARPRMTGWRRRLARHHMAHYARTHGLPRWQAPSVNHASFLAMMNHARPDIGVVANFGEILKQPLLQLPRHGFINFHPSPLPRYRGPSPLSHMLLQGETRGAVTWHQIVPRIDAGDILAQEEFPIAAQDTTEELTRRAETLGARMLPALLASIAAGKCRPQPQNEANASYYPNPSDAQKQHLKELDMRKRTNRYAETT